MSVLLAPVLPAQGAASAPAAPSVEKKPKKEKPAEREGTISPEAAETNAIIEKHRDRQVTAHKAVLAQMASPLMTDVPSDPVARKAWRKQMWAALGAIHQSVQEADKAMRVELEDADSRRHPEK